MHHLMQGLDIPPGWVAGEADVLLPHQMCYPNHVLPKRVPGVGVEVGVTGARGLSAVGLGL